MRRPSTERSDAFLEARCARQWLGLALLVLVLAGVFALLVVIGRMPPFDRYVTDPLFFKRCLVVHVNLALVVWFYSMVAALLLALPGRGAPGRLTRASPYLGVAGVFLMLLAAGAPGTQPVLSNYIPAIDHWLFGAGQLIFGAGVLASFLDRGVLGRNAEGRSFLEIPDAARPGLQAVAAALVLAAITFALAWLHRPQGAAPEAQHELLVWGGGHVLQLACTLAMVSVWIILLGSALGGSPIRRRSATLLFGAMLLPWTVAPLLTLAGAWSDSYRTGFTQLMRWAIFPGVLAFLCLCGAALQRARRDGRTPAPSLADPRIAAFLVSGALTLLGFALGACIRGSNTMVPAHYHASIGGVTVAFMAVTYLMLRAFGLPNPTRRLRRAAAWQPLVYGFGQIVFAAGFGFAGIHGMSRKAYGAEQVARGFAETVGLAVMGAGGFLAIAGGLLFIGVVIALWRRGVVTHPKVDLAEGSWRYRWL
ncbi:MAG: hypothetical protein JSU66_01350 [Deltaproteobacteria bacterium]|nr:MAG: hypothetical protein JSU66_01350 [Deltaproteobacteria bacterium]